MKMSKVLKQLFLLSIIFICLFSFPAYGHELARNGAIGNKLKTDSTNAESEGAATVTIGDFITEYNRLVDIGKEEITGAEGIEKYDIDHISFMKSDPERTYSIMINGEEPANIAYDKDSQLYDVVLRARDPSNMAECGGADIVYMIRAFLTVYGIDENELTNISLSLMLQEEYECDGFKFYTKRGKYTGKSLSYVCSAKEVLERIDR